MIRAPVLISLTICNCIVLSATCIYLSSCNYCQFHEPVDKHLACGRPPTAAEMEPHNTKEVMAAALKPELSVTAPQPGRPARAGGKGRFLLCSFREVLDGLESTACSLREAYSDTVYFKCAP